MSKTSTKQQVPTGKEMEIDPRFAAIVEGFAKDPQVTYGKMMASLGLKVNAKIFAMMSKGKFVVKLPKDRVTRLVQSGQGERFDPGHGRLMNERIAISHRGVPWIDLAREAYHFVKHSKQK